MKRALVTGSTGQDGTHLSKLLLEKGYAVYGLMRRQSRPSLDNLREAGVLSNPNFEIVEGDMTDYASLDRFVGLVKPEEVYNLAAQSHVKVSFDEPVHSTMVDYVGVLYLLEIIRNRSKATRFYQAGTSEMFGGTAPPQDENTVFCPRSPYAVAKLAAFWSVQNYREGYGLHASTGILFNHESEYRGTEFVTRKISKWVVDFHKNMMEGAVRTDPLQLGNLDAKRDWGYAGDYVDAMWRMLQQDKPDDYVIGTGESHTVREFVQAAFDALLPPETLVAKCVEWRGSGDTERGYLDGTQVVAVNPKFYRPLEVNFLQANASKARTRLGWQPKVSFKELVHLMVKHDLG